MKNEQKKVYVRWLGAFRGNRYTLSQSVIFEMARRDKAAAECLQLSRGKFLSKIAPAKSVVGLLVRNSVIYRGFDYDCWSEYDKNGQLHATRNRHEAPPQTSKFWHTESWVDCSKGNHILGMVVYGSWTDIPIRTREQVKKALRVSGLGLYCLNYKGQLVKIDPK